MIFVTFWFCAAETQPASAQTPKKVKMTIPVIAHSMMPVYLAQSRGYFADEKLELDMTSTSGGGPDIRALIAGDVDFSFTTGDNVILAHQEGKRLLMVMSGLNKVFINWAMHKESAKSKGITESTPLAEKLKALKGLTVGVTNPGALTAHLAAFVIRKAGYNPQQDVQIVPIGSGPTWIAALENRKVDVALTAPPTPETAIGRGYAIMLINNAKGEDPSIAEFLMENLIVRPETATKDQDTIRRMVRALTRANQWALKSTPEQVADALKPSMANIAPDLLLAGVKSVLPALSADGRTSERSVQITQDVLSKPASSKSARLSGSLSATTSSSNDQPRPTIFLPPSLWHGVAGILGNQLRSLDRPILGFESFVGVCLSLRRDRRWFDFRPSGDHPVRNLHGLFDWRRLRHRPRLCLGAPRDIGADSRPLRRCVQRRTADCLSASVHHLVRYRPNFENYSSD